MVQKKTAMKHLKSMALLAFTILAACAKEEINIPDNPPPHHRLRTKCGQIRDIRHRWK